MVEFVITIQIVKTLNFNFGLLEHICERLDYISTSTLDIYNWKMINESNKSVKQAIEIY